MDGQKFDKLTRAFATGTDRRTLLKFFGGATAASVAGVTLARTNGVFAQDCPGDGSPGACCSTVEDCNDGLFCVIQGDVGAEGICACTESGLGDPWLGCDCTTGTLDPCGDSDNLCCATTDAEGGPGVCQAECTQVDDSCISGTEGACDAYNEENGTDYICCNYGGADGSAGTCVAESACVVEPPNTGSGTTAATENWIAPAAAIGAAAAVIAYKGRERKAETEA
jgi:hypothetical protein